MTMTLQRSLRIIFKILEPFEKKICTKVRVTDLQNSDVFLAFLNVEKIVLDFPFLQGIHFEDTSKFPSFDLKQ